MCLASCVGAAVCCAGTMCCQSLCLPAKALGVASKNYAKIGYVLFDLFWLITAIIFFYFFSWAIDWTENIGIQCPEASGSGSACFASSGMVRMSWALCFFHLFVFLVILARNDCAAMFHDGWWCLKFLIVLGLFVSAMWIPNDVIIVYMQIAKYVSIAFLCYQAVLMLIVAYVLNDVLVGNVNAEAGEAMSCSGVILLVLFLLFTGGNITWIVFSFIKFGGCADNVWFMIITCIFGVLAYTIVLFRTREDASIFTSSIVLAYALYLQWSALSSKDDATCNPYLNSGFNTTLELIMGLVFTFVALLVISGSTQKDDKDTITHSLNAPMMEKEGDDNEAVADLKDGDDMKTAEEMHVFPVTSATILFQALLVLASIYYAMLLTNWGSPSMLDDTT